MIEKEKLLEAQQELDGASPDSIKVHAVKTTPPIASRAELVDKSAIFGNMYESFQADGNINDLDHSVLDALLKRGNDVVMAPSIGDVAGDAVDGIVRDQSMGERSNDFKETLEYILAHDAVPNTIVVPEGLTKDNLRIAKETVEQYRQNDVHKDKDAWFKSLQAFLSSNLFTGRLTGTNVWVCSSSTNSNAMKKERNEVGNQRLIERL